MAIIRLAPLVALIAVAICPRLAAQQSAPDFEVASIKRNTTADEIATFRAEPGRVTATNITVRDLILRAYELQQYELAGGPDWIDRERFDIAARSESQSSGPVAKLVQSLLAARFRLVVHRDMREVPAFNLVFARADKKLGSALKRSTEECDAEGRPLSRTSGIPVLPPTFKQGVITGCRLIFTPGWIMGAGQPMSVFARRLTQHLGRFVADRTGLTDRFDFSVSYLPEDRARPIDMPADFPAIDPNAPALSTALQEQLGLKLEPSRGFADVLVIDSVERPTPN
jgi:uncharacterized protein (TIGR03435 family)